MFFRRWRSRNETNEIERHRIDAQFGGNIAFADAAGDIVDTVGQREHYPASGNLGAAGAGHSDGPVQAAVKSGVIRRRLQFRQFFLELAPIRRKFLHQLHFAAESHQSRLIAVGHRIHKGGERIFHLGELPGRQGLGDINEQHIADAFFSVLERRDSGHLRRRQTDLRREVFLCQSFGRNFSRADDVGVDGDGRQPGRSLCQPEIINRRGGAPTRRTPAGGNTKKQHEGPVEKSAPFPHTQ